MPKLEHFTVRISVRPEQVEQLKAHLAELEKDGPAKRWKNWKDYARTVAALGFSERLIERHKLHLRTRQEAPNGPT